MVRLKRNAAGAVQSMHKYSIVYRRLLNCAPSQLHLGVAVLGPYLVTSE